MNRTVCFLSLLLAATALPCRAQDGDNAVALQSAVVASSRIFTSPSSPDPLLRNASRDVGASFAWSASYARAVAPSAWVQACLDYTPVDDETIDNFGTRLTDGFRLFSAELTGIFELPISGRTFLLFIEGGAGVYWGTRRLSVAGVGARALSTRAAFGIVTAFGAEYRLTRLLSLKAQLRFRDPQVDAENVFDQPSVEAGGVRYVLETTPFTSRLNPNGNIYAAGIVLRF
jgi:hypothetical protein